MPRYKLVIEYVGSLYHGWQIQPDCKTIAGEIQKAIKKYCSQDAELYGSGRTDAGVHAFKQVAHFDLQGVHDIFRIKEAVNFYLQNKEIIILDCQQVNDDFHARFSAKFRSYKYFVLNRYANPIIDANRVWHIKHKIDLDLIDKAIKEIKGKHDFSSFRAAECQSKSPIKEITELSYIVSNDKIVFYIKARSFLHHMVRNIVGSLIDLGVGKMTYEKFISGFQACDRSKMGVTAPACGLFFNQVDY